MDRRDPPGVHQVAFLAAEDLRLLVGELQMPAVAGHRPRDGDLSPSL